MRLKYLSFLLIFTISSCSDPKLEDKTTNTQDPFPTSSSPNVPVPSPSISGKVADGYLVGATVCLDSNNNLHCDAHEPTTISSTGGKFEFNLIDDSFRQYAIVVEVTTSTIDEDTNERVKTAYTLSAPIGKTNFISPITTLIYQAQRNNVGFTETQARAFVRNQLHLNEYFDLYADYILNKDEINNNYSIAYGISQTIARMMAKNKSILINAFSNNPSSEELKVIENIVNTKVLTLLSRISTKVYDLINQSNSGRLTVEQAQYLASTELKIFNDNLTFDEASKLIKDELALLNTPFQISTESAVDFFKKENPIYELKSFTTKQTISKDYSQNIQTIDQIFSISKLISNGNIYTSQCSSSPTVSCPSIVNINSPIDVSFSPSSNNKDINILIDRNQINLPDLYYIFLNEIGFGDILAVDASTVKLNESISLRSLANYEQMMNRTEALEKDITVDFTEGDELYVLTFLGTRKHLPTIITFDSICGSDGSKCLTNKDNYYYSPITTDIQSYLNTLPTETNPKFLSYTSLLYWISSDKSNWLYCATQNGLNCSGKTKNHPSYYDFNEIKTTQYDRYLVIGNFEAYIDSNLKYNSAHVIFEAGTEKYVRPYRADPKSYTHSITYFNRSAFSKIIDSLRSYSNSKTMLQQMTAVELLNNNDVLYLMSSAENTTKLYTIANFFDPITSSLQIKVCDILINNCVFNPPDASYDLVINSDSTITMKIDNSLATTINSVTKQKLIGNVNYQSLFKGTVSPNTFPQLNHNIVFNEGDFKYDFELTSINNITEISTLFNETAFKKIIESINQQLNL